MEATWHHVAISVRDMDKALRFYRDLLGFDVDWERDHYTGEAMARVVGLGGADARVVMLKGYGARVELFKYYTPAGEDGGPKRQCDFGLTHLALTVKKIHDSMIAFPGPVFISTARPRTCGPGSGRLT